MSTIAIIAPGAMGSAVAKLLSRNGANVLTNLTGRSEDSKRRAQEAGMKDASLKEIASTCDWILSILPPSEAFSLAEKYLQASAGNLKENIYVDCNAVNPVTVKQIAALFKDSTTRFVDAGIIGGPPRDSYNPTFYASHHEEALLDKFVGLSKFGLKVSALKGEGAGIGDASALKMSYAGITKGTTGLFTTMILGAAAHQSSPATAQALLQELHASQPALLKRISAVIPPMVPKAYRWVGEMTEIAGFVGEGEGDIYTGMSKLYSRIEKGDKEDLEVLSNFVNEAKAVVEQQTRE